MDSLIARAVSLTMRGLIQSVLSVAALTWCPIGAQTLFWSSPPNAVNLTSSGQPMDAGFRFELGVFIGSFVPTTDNKAEWATHWKPVQRRGYDAATKRYAGAHSPDDNLSPFNIGKPVYVWGFRGDAIAAEWILFRASTWVFPDANPPVPPPANAYEWYANAPGLIVVIGSIQSSGSPFLMRSASVIGALPPPTSWDQWRTAMLAGVPLNGELDDPDGDGSSNLIEFAFGRDPRVPGAAPAMPLTLVRVANQDHLQIRVPRRKDHPVPLAVQVSSNLANWDEGSAFVEIISDGPSEWVVRDRTPYPSSGARRFMRIKATRISP